MHHTQTTHILIAEDNPGDVRLIRLAVSETEGWNTRVSVARDGAQAIAMLEACTLDSATTALRAAARHASGVGPQLHPEIGDLTLPDLVILDFNLPKRSGIEVLKTIRLNDRLQKLPVVVLSSSPEYFLREKVEGAQLEATCYITKPPDFDEFVQLGGHIRRCYEAGRKQH